MTHRSTESVGARQRHRAPPALWAKRVETDRAGKRLLHPLESQLCRHSRSPSPPQTSRLQGNPLGTEKLQSFLQSSFARLFQNQGCTRTRRAKSEENMRERIALPDGRVVLGTLVAEDPAARAWTAVSSRPCCLAAIPTDASGGRQAAGSDQTRRWFFTGQPISVSQTAALARQSEFVVLLNDGAVWLCSFAARQAARPSKRSKHASAKLKGRSFAIEADTRASAAGAQDYGEARKLAHVRPGAKFIHAQEDRAVVISWDNFGGPGISIVALQPQEGAEGWQLRVPCRPLGGVDMVSCCTIIQRQPPGKGTCGGAASSHQHLTLEPQLFSALFGHGTVDAVLVVADGSTGHLAFAPLGSHPRLQRMSNFFMQDEPVEHLLGISLATSTSQSFLSSRTASNGFLAVTATGAAVAFFCEVREQKSGAEVGGVSINSCRVVLPIRPPLVSCCTIPLRHQDDDEGGAGNLMGGRRDVGGGLGEGEGGGAARVASVVVCVCGAGVSVFPIGYAAAGGGGGGGGGGGSAPSGLAASIAAAPASVSFGPAFSLPLPSAIFEVSPVFLPVFLPLASRSRGSTARATTTSGGGAGDWACILMVASLQGIVAGREIDSSIAAGNGGSQLRLSGAASSSDRSALVESIRWSLEGISSTHRCMQSLRGDAQCMQQATVAMNKWLAVLRTAPAIILKSTLYSGFYIGNIRGH